MDDNTDLINTIYKEIDDLVLFETDAKELDEDKYSFEVKEVIVQYMNPDSYIDMYEVNTTGEHNDRIDKKIRDALAVLEQYNTDEYKCLVEHGYYNPFKEREGFKKVSAKGISQVS